MTSSLSMTSAAISRAPSRSGRRAKPGGVIVWIRLRLRFLWRRAGKVDGIAYAPLNKTSLHLGGMKSNGELPWFAEQLGHTGPSCEFNVLDDLWTSRVTSHLAIRDVSSQTYPGSDPRDHRFDPPRLAADRLWRSRGSRSADSIRTMGTMEAAAAKSWTS